jgi:hypothetical protein
MWAPLRAGRRVPTLGARQAWAILNVAARAIALFSRSLSRLTWRHRAATRTTRCVPAGKPPAVTRRAKRRRGLCGRRPRRRPPSSPLARRKHRRRWHGARGPPRQGEPRCRVALALDAAPTRGGAGTQTRRPARYLEVALQETSTHTRGRARARVRQRSRGGVCLYADRVRCCAPAWRPSAGAATVVRRRGVKEGRGSANAEHGRGPVGLARGCGLPRFQCRAAAAARARASAGRTNKAVRRTRRAKDQRPARLTKSWTGSSAARDAAACGAGRGQVSGKYLRQASASFRGQRQPPSPRAVKRAVAAGRRATRGREEKSAAHEYGPRPRRAASARQGPSPPLAKTRPQPALRACPAGPSPRCPATS